MVASYNPRLTQSTNSECSRYVESQNEPTNTYYRISVPRILASSTRYSAASFGLITCCGRKISNIVLSVWFWLVETVVDTKVIRAYLTGLDNWALKSADWTNVARQDAGLDVLWLPDLDHGQVFKAKGTRSKLFEIVQRFCDG